MLSASDNPAAPPRAADGGARRVVPRRGAPAPRHPADGPLLLPEHLPALDGLRGLAIALVLIKHLAIDPKFYPLALQRWLMPFPYACWVGVDLFFVLSGFLITRILLQAKGGDGYFRNFYARRLLRIFPLYYGFLIVYFVVLPLLFHGFAHTVATKGSDQIFLWTYTYNLAGMPHTMRLNTCDMPHFWSLAVEEHFYFIWPLAVYLLSRRALVRACIGCFVVAMAVRCTALATHWIDTSVDDRAALSLYMFTPARFDTLAAGALLAVVTINGITAHIARALRHTAACSGILLGVIVLHDGGLMSLWPPMQTVGYTLMAIFLAAVLALAVMRDERAPRRTLWSAAPLRFMGKYSYGIYLLHQPLLNIMDHHFGPERWLALLHWRALALAGYTLAGGTAGVVAAYLSYNLFEKHFLKLKRFFAYRKGAAQTPAAAPRPVDAAA